MHALACRHIQACTHAQADTCLECASACPHARMHYTRKHTSTHTLPHTNTHKHKHTSKQALYMRAHAHTNTYINTHVQALGKLPTGVGAGIAKNFLKRVRGCPGLLLIFMSFGFWGEYGKVRYTPYIYMTMVNPIYIESKQSCKQIVLKGKES